MAAVVGPSANVPLLDVKLRPCSPHTLVRAPLAPPSSTPISWPPGAFPPRPRAPIDSHLPNPLRKPYHQVLRETSINSIWEGVSPRRRLGCRRDEVLADMGPYALC